MNVYEACPNFENEKYLIRLISKDDVKGLYNVYSDRKAVPYFNSDNCDGDSFYYDTIEKMTKGLKFWLDSYQCKYFVRWTIIDKSLGKIIGTFEGFEKDNLDESECVMRLDLHSTYEKEEVIRKLVSLVYKSFFELFNSNIIITKIPEFAEERKKAFLSLGYEDMHKPIIGNDETKYYDYYFLRNK